MAEVEKLIEIYQQLEDAGLMVVAGKKDTAELMVSNDVVPVVRCKDCAFFKKGAPFRHECKNVRGMFYVKPDDFCSYGERRSDESCDD